jgi:hypothetical protein
LEILKEQLPVIIDDRIVNIILESFNKRLKLVADDKSEFGYFSLFEEHVFVGYFPSFTEELGNESKFD